MIIIWRGGVRLKLDFQDQGSRRILGVSVQVMVVGGGGLENWSIFVDAICASSHIRISLGSKSQLQQTIFIIWNKLLKAERINITIEF